MPFPRPSLNDEFVQVAAPLVLKLCCTSSEMIEFWNRMAVLGFVEKSNESIPASAFQDEGVRARARALLEALVAKVVFGFSIRELDAAIDGFPQLCRREENEFGSFRSRYLALKAYESLGNDLGASCEAFLKEKTI
jgi:hypothetical protein